MTAGRPGAGLRTEIGQSQASCSTSRILRSTAAGVTVGAGGCQRRGGSAGAVAAGGGAQVRCRATRSRSWCRGGRICMLRHGASASVRRRSRLAVAAATVLSPAAVTVAAPAVAAGTAAASPAGSPSSATQPPSRLDRRRCGLGRCSSLTARTASFGFAILVRLGQAGRQGPVLSSP